MAQAQPPADDPTIENDTKLWRRIPLKPSHVVLDQNTNSVRPSSAAFDDPSDGTAMSVVIDIGQDPNTALLGHADCALAAVTAGILREQGLVIVRKPLEHEPNHAEIFGPKTKLVRSKLAKAAFWVIAPL